MGRLHIRAVSSRNLVHELPSAYVLSPVCLIKVGGQKFSTKPHLNGGRSPTWNEKTVFEVNEPHKEHVEIAIIDRRSNSNIGQCRVAVQICLHGEVLDKWFQLTRGNRVVGEVNLRLQLLGLAPISNQDTVKQQIFQQKGRPTATRVEPNKNQHIRVSQSRIHSTNSGTSKVEVKRSPVAQNHAEQDLLRDQQLADALADLELEELKASMSMSTCTSHHPQTNQFLQEELTLAQKTAEIAAESREKQREAALAAAKEEERLQRIALERVREQRAAEQRRIEQETAEELAQQRQAARIEAENRIKQQEAFIQAAKEEERRQKLALEREREQRAAEQRRKELELAQECVRQQELARQEAAKSQAEALERLRQQQAQQQQAIYQSLQQQRMQQASQAQAQIRAMQENARRSAYNAMQQQLQRNHQQNAAMFQRYNFQHLYQAHQPPQQPANHPTADQAHQSPHDAQYHHQSSEAQANPVQYGNYMDQVMNPYQSLDPNAYANDYGFDYSYGNPSCIDNVYGGVSSGFDPNMFGGIANGFDVSSYGGDMFGGQDFGGGFDAGGSFF